MHIVFLLLLWPTHLFTFFFFNDTATTEIYTLSLHDALPIWSPTTICRARSCRRPTSLSIRIWTATPSPVNRDRKSTRLNSSHSQISYAVFCLKKKTKKTTLTIFEMIDKTLLTSTAASPPRVH